MTSKQRRFEGRVPAGWDLFSTEMLHGRRSS